MILLSVIKYHAFQNMSQYHLMIKSKYTGNREKKNIIKSRKLQLLNLFHYKNPQKTSSS